MPGLGSFILVMLLAAIAPLLAFVSVVLACIPRTRRLGVQLLLFSFFVALSLMLGWTALSIFFHVPYPYSWQVSFICFGALFAISYFSLAGWRFVRCARPNSPAKGAREKPRAA
jgi:hypothetical protein